MYTPCDRANEACQFYETELGCVKNTHHKLWPRNRYKTDVEKQFRQLPQNKEDMCMDEHRELHATTPPPPKPSHAEMLLAINGFERPEVA